jgi:tetratricopeptide (TPR) repeat protein
MKLRETLGEPAASRANFAVGAADALTGSIDALRPFAMGTRVRALQGEEAAMPFFERAVQLDPNFAAAWAKLGVVASNSGYYDRAREAAKKAHDLRAKTTEFERLYIDWNHAAHNIRDHAAVRTALDKLVATYPRDFAAYNNLGVAYEQAAALAPVEPVLAVNIVYAKLFLGRRDEAYQAMDKILAQRPDPNVAIARWHSAVLAGDANAVAFEQTASKIVAPPQLLMVRSTVAAWQGRLKAYSALVADLRKQALEAKNAEAAHSLESAERLTRAAYERGSALTALEAATRTESDRAILAQNASFLASIGRIDAAAAAVARLETQPLDGQPVFLPVAIAKAYIRVARGQPKEAVQDIDATIAEFPHALDLHFHLGRIRELAGDLAGAAKSYRTTLQVLPQLGLNPQIVPVRIYLANVLTKQGDTAGAKEQLDALRAQWKDRDTDFALSREVR